MHDTARTLYYNFVMRDPKNKDTTFSVWLDFACAPDSAGNTLSIQCGTEKLLYKVQSTGSWDAYQLQ